MVCFHLARDKEWINKVPPLPYSKVGKFVTNGLVISYWAMTASIKKDDSTDAG
jgi:hypothetical protein